MSIREDALKIIDEAIKAVYPENAVKKALENLETTGGIKVVAIGKAAFRMTMAAREILKDRISEGIVITKYGHSMGDIKGVEIFEAGHPIPDENTIRATNRALDIVRNLKKDDILLLLISGGGSSLFELPTENVELEDLIDINDQLVKSGAAILEINAVRKHLSKVKGGRFAETLKPIKILSLVLSDVLGDRLDTVASGPAHPDSTTSQDALRVIQKHDIKLSPKVLNALRKETPKSLENVETRTIGSIFTACETAERAAEKLGYNSIILTTTLDCEAREAGAFLSAIVRELALKDRPVKKPCAIILGGGNHCSGKRKGIGRKKSRAGPFCRSWHRGIR